MFNDAKQAIAYIESKRAKRSFDDFKQLLIQYNIPTDLKHVIHVAGTNGKGSTTTFIRDLFIKHGYHVGTFTSPYIIVHNERISIDGKPISDEELLELVNEIIDMIEKENLSMFEIDVILMLLYFHRHPLDYYIIECGIGGLTDKTNVLTGEISLITNIGYDHQFMLGETLDQIASHKLGIVKNSGYLYSTEQDENLIQQFNQYCKDKQATYYPIQINTQDTQHIIYKDYQYTIDLPTYQISNALLALHAINHFIELDHQLVQEVFNQFHWPCRFEYVEGYYLDGAHNIDGVKALIQTIKDKKLEDTGIVFSALDDKDVSIMLELLKDYDVMFAGFNDERLKSKHIPFEKALPMMKEKHECVVVTGSLHFVSQVRAYLIKQ